MYFKIVIMSEIYCEFEPEECLLEYIQNEDCENIIKYIKSVERLKPFNIRNNPLANNIKYIFSLPIYKKLLKYNDFICFTNGDGYNILQLYLEYNEFADIKIVKQLKSLTNIQDNFGSIAVLTYYASAEELNMEIVKYLLEKMENINQKDIYDNSLIGMFIDSDSIMEYLIMERKANYRVDYLFKNLLAFDNKRMCLYILSKEIGYHPDSTDSDIILYIREEFIPGLTLYLYYVTLLPYELCEVICESLYFQ